MDLANIIQNIISWFLNHGIKITGLLIGTIVLNNFVKSSLKRFFEKQIENTINHDGKKKRIKTIIDIFDDIVVSIVWIIVILMILSEISVDTSPLLATLGAIGLAFAFAARGIAKDFLQGVFILVEDQFRIGDKIKIAGLEGRVIDLNPRTTILKTEDGTTHIVPNSEIKIVSKNK